MEWTEEHGNCLCQEILVLEPCQGPDLGKNCKQSEWRAVRERYTLLSKKFKAKMKDEEKAGWN